RTSFFFSKGRATSHGIGRFERGVLKKSGAREWVLTATPKSSRMLVPNLSVDFRRVHIERSLQRCLSWKGHPRWRHQMPLGSGSATVVDQAGVISIQMRDHERVVRVDIRHEVLIGQSQLGSAAAVPKFEMNRDMIERLASAKYDSSDYVTYPNGAVVSINGE